MACSLGKVQSPKSRDTGFSVGASSPGEQGDYFERLFKLYGEDFGVVSVLQPPRLFALNVALRGGGEADAAPVQCERSSLRTSSASTSLPAATSASDDTSASRRAARSSSSSQSPGSNGSSSISVPSGRSVGSSTTKRPSRTCALMLMLLNLAPRLTPNKSFDRSVRRRAWRAIGAVGEDAPMPRRRTHRAAGQLERYAAGQSLDIPNMVCLD